MHQCFCIWVEVPLPAPQTPPTTAWPAQAVHGDAPIGLHRNTDYRLLMSRPCSASIAPCWVPPEIQFSPVRAAPHRRSAQKASPCQLSPVQLNRTFMRNLCLLLGLTWLGLAFPATAAPTDSLESGFLNPPDSAKPQTWWHWMNGNITKAGITADLEAMKQIGLGGATIVNVDCGIPRGPVPFMSPGMAGRFQIRRAGGQPARTRTVRGKLRRLVQQRRPVEHRNQRDAARHDQRSACDRPDAFQRHAAAAAARNWISTATSPCWPFPRRQSGAPLQDLDAKDGRNGKFVLSSANASDSTDRCHSRPRKR